MVVLPLAISQKTIKNDINLSSLFAIWTVAKNPQGPCKHWPHAFIADAKPVTAMVSAKNIARGPIFCQFLGNFRGARGRGRRPVSRSHFLAICNALNID